MHGDFLSATGANPHPCFGAILGKMLLETGEITQEEFDLLGEVQARTVLIAEAYDRGDIAQREIILGRFEGRGDTAGKLDMDGAMFGLKIETAVQELDGFLADLAIEELDTKLKGALEKVSSGKGVRDDAASIGAITKALLLTDRSTKSNIVNASLIMQHSVRTLERLERFQKGDYDRQAALELMNICDKQNYKFDPPALVKANEELIFVCTVERMIASHLERNPEEIHTMRKKHELAIKDAITTLIDVMPEASAMYREASKNELADKADQVHCFYAQRYEGLVQAPHVMLTKEEHAKYVAQGAPSRDGMN